jgi:hypothetical protein
VHRVKLLCEHRVSYGALVATRSGAVGWVQPLSPSHHESLSCLSRALYTNVAHVAGLNPQRFRMPSTESGLGLGNGGYGAPPPADGVLDGELLWEFLGLSRVDQERAASAAGVAIGDVLVALQEASLASAFY